MTTTAAKFDRHVGSVRNLMNFDRDVLNFAIDVIKPLPERLRRQGIDNPEMTGERALQVLTGIRRNDSLRTRYQAIFNQALVLLVSYFSSSVHDIFRRAVEHALRSNEDFPQLLREDLRLTLGTLKELDFDLAEVAPDLLIQAKEISFQDMQSIARAFKTYLDIHIEKNEHVNDIIAAQACRHVIVHAGARVDDRLLRQTKNAQPRRIKEVLRLDEQVQFSPDEVDIAAQAMTAYIAKLSQLVFARLGTNV